MTRVILHGCNGRMGRMIEGLCKEEEEVSIVAGVDAFPREDKTAFPVYTALSEVSEEADAVIDFSTAKALDPLFSFCEEKKLPLVLCTTGLSEEQLDRMKALSEKIPVLKSANMSLGINLLLDLCARAARILSEAGFDIEILEKHHNQKLDAPSGTALALYDSINEAMDGAFHEVFDRSKDRRKREKKEIGISAIRGGNIVGEHSVFFAGTDEVIELKHTATSRAVFAKGAIAAAKYLAAREPGLYDMRDVIG
ncbi:MAG: 4-hydroxy-tetrahydrodipicolinate reductase [Lachnospiraceae bacterium]|nr:4-hydroxy-tetrahydrodipicolinate reductase [Lachnospiraceae bacterium]